MRSDARDGALRVAIFGGSFHPPHAAHVLSVAYVLACAEVDRVVVVPCFQHPFGKALASFDDRMEMCRRAFASLRDVEVSDVERALGGDSVTARTLEHLHAEHPDWSMRLIVGSDVADELDRWTRPEVVRALAPPLVIARAGAAAHAEALPIAIPELSSSDIRARLASGASIAGLVPRSVAAWIAERGLYR